MNEKKFLNQIKANLNTAVVGDIMDQLGFQNQFLTPKIKPLRDDMIVIGRAMPVLETDTLDNTSTSSNAMLKKPFGLMLEALDQLKENEIYLCTGGTPSYALWGELMSTRALQCGASGAVLNGYSRDTLGILKLNFPTFSYGTYAQDQAPRGKVIDFRVPVKIDNVAISPGDIVFGDIDGVCIIPQEIDKKVVELALEKVKGENLVRKSIEAGMSSVEAFNKYGIM
ncbi:RraA family protein [Flavobacteriaceae bacterium]|nr:RraA family protein [Flavobacteriaceae bacterium]MDC3329791.1 RraA family protein [Flavobacteriaceae bacterium]